MFLVDNIIIMNQILCTKLDKKSDKLKKKNWFKFQFIFSIVGITVLIICVFNYYYQLKQKENFSNNLLSNYSIYKLYNNSNYNNYTAPSSELFRNY